MHAHDSKRTERFDFHGAGHHFHRRRILLDGSLEQRAVHTAWKAVGIRITGVSFAEARRPAMAAMGRHETNGQIAALSQKLDRLSEEVHLLAKDLAAMKPAAAYSEQRRVSKTGAGAGA